MDYLYDLLDGFRGISKENNEITTKNDYDEIEYEIQRNIVVNEFKEAIPEELSYPIYMMVGKLLIGQSIKISDMNTIEDTMKHASAHMSSYTSLAKFIEAHGMNYSVLINAVLSCVIDELKVTDGYINLKSLYTIAQNLNKNMTDQQQIMDDDSEEYVCEMYDELNRHKYISEHDKHDEHDEDHDTERVNKKSRYE